MKSTMKIIYELSKFRISIMSSVSALTGFVLAARGLTWEAVSVIGGVVLLACGASALNQVQEKEIDARMLRTRNRPIPSGRLTAGAALAIALALLAAGSVCLAGNTTALALGLLTVAWYNGVYTPLKRVSPLAAIPGGLVGALPPMIGWVGGGGALFDPIIVSIAFFFFVWQVPHFWLLLLRIGDDYERAGMPTLTTIFSRKQLTRVTYVWMVATGVTCMVIPVVLVPGVAIHAALLVASAWLILQATRMVRSNGKRLAFVEINVYALVVMSLLSLSGFVR